MLEFKWIDGPIGWRLTETARTLDAASAAAITADGFAPNVLRATIHFVNSTESFHSALGRSVECAGLANYCPVLVAASRVLAGSVPALATMFSAIRRACLHNWNGPQHLSLRHGLQRDSGTAETAGSTLWVARPKGVCRRCRKPMPACEIAKPCCTGTTTHALRLPAAARHRLCLCYPTGSLSCKEFSQRGPGQSAPPLQRIQHSFGRLASLTSQVLDRQSKFRSGRRSFLPFEPEVDRRT